MSVAKSLSEEQVAQIQKWADENAGLPGIQQNLAETFEIKLTYMETRFLIDDLNIRMPEDEKPDEEDEKEEVSESASDGGDLETDAAEPGAADPPDETGPASPVTVTISELERPGAMVSGRVTFADGEKAEWYMDQMGRLGMNPDNADHKPNESDMMEFQKELQRVAKEKGF